MCAGGPGTAWGERTPVCTNEIQSSSYVVERWILLSEVTAFQSKKDGPGVECHELGVGPVYTMVRDSQELAVWASGAGGRSAMDPTRFPLSCKHHGGVLPIYTIVSPRKGF